MRLDRLLIIQAEHQGQGIGREAARAIEDSLEREGWREIQLSVLESNERALPFWQHIGYDLIDERADTTGRPCWVLAKRLKPDAPAALAPS